MQSHFVHAGEMQHQVPDEGYEPQQHVGEVYPDCILHAYLTALVWCWVGVDVDFSEDAEYDCPEDAACLISTTFLSRIQQ